MSNVPHQITFLGATGGCTNAALVLSLQAGYHCSALARTPSKLTDMLLSAGLTQATMDTYLTIIQGDVKDPSALQHALRPRGSLSPLIVSGIGGALGRHPQPTICQDTTKHLLSALDAIAPPVRPMLVSISTTGISDGPRDVPLAMLPLYVGLLKVPHDDKRLMEQETVAAGRAGRLGGWMFVRPSFLTDGKEIGMGRIRVGSEEHPEVGYTISRKDVGRWLFEETIQGDAWRWNGRKVTISY